MAWQCYEVIFRLRTPVHIGWSKAGNVQRTRSYVTGRVVWGALTMRLTRDQASRQGAAAPARAYREMGEQVHQHLAYSYFYAATMPRDCATTMSRDKYEIAWPWENPSRFRQRFLSSYSSTALSYPQQSAATGMLHEVEFLAPHTIDTGEPVYFVGYIFASDSCTLPWQAACQRLQVGGERGYGWGDLTLLNCERVNDELFKGQIRFDGSQERPVLQLQPGQSLLAHALAKGISASGDVEPLVGREWQHHPGQRVAHSGICFTPGSRIDQPLDVVVERFGMWQESVD